MKLFLLLFFSLFASFSFAQIYWEPINFPDSLYSQAINAEKENILFFSSGGNNKFHGLFRSYDDGITWEYINVNPPGTHFPIFSIRYNSDGVLFLGSSYGIYRSFNDGDSFEKIFSGASNNILKINFSPSNDIYSVGWSDIFRSSDGGDTWETLFSGVNTQYFSDIDFGLNGEIYAVGGDFMMSGKSFYRSFDNGETWETVDVTNGNWHFRSVRVNANGVIIVSGFDTDSIYSSADQGSTWSRIADVSADVMEKFDDDKLIAGRYINGYSGCWLSEDWGNTWISLIDTVIYPHVHQISISPSDYIYLQCEYNHQLFKSINPLLRTDTHLPSVEIKLFPNPATNKLFIETETSFNIKHFTIYNQNGQKVFSGDLVYNYIDTSKLLPGMYILELEMEKYLVRKKLIIE